MSKLSTGFWIWSAKQRSEAARQRLRRRLLLLDILRGSGDFTPTRGSVGRLARELGCSESVLRKDLSDIGWLPARSVRVL